MKPGSAPCMNCTTRRVGCHADCNKYKDWREELTALTRAERLRKQGTKYPVVIYPDEKGGRKE